MLKEPIFNIKYINVEYIFYKISQIVDFLFLCLKKFFIFLSDLLVHFWIFLKSGIMAHLIQIIFTFVILIICGFIFYMLIRLAEVKKEQKNKLNKILLDEKVEDIGNQRWEEVLRLINSKNPTDWRMAIIESDLILEEMVTHMGYKGENLGEKLKSVEESDFSTLQYAWEAHKIRNRIAHEGSSYGLNHDEARRVVSLFEAVFKDNKYM